jgi:hypothetical protein
MYRIASLSHKYESLTTVQLVGLAMWGLLFASVVNGLGKSLNVLDDAEISKVQKVSKTHILSIS